MFTVGLSALNGVSHLKKFLQQTSEGSVGEHVHILEWWSVVILLNSTLVVHS